MLFLLLFDKIFMQFLLRELIDLPSIRDGFEMNGWLYEGTLSAPLAFHMTT
jgi:hypothetical protein